LIVEFVDQYQDRFGVEPICVQLSELGCKFAPSTYYEARGQKPSARALRDEEIKELIVKAYDENYQCYGARKMWLHLRQAGHAVARCTVERLMHQLGLQGACRGKIKRTTIADPAAARAGDLVGRKFSPCAPNRLWVADFTY
jgi:putative transposase